EEVEHGVVRLACLGCRCDTNLPGVPVATDDPGPRRSREDTQPQACAWVAHDPKDIRDSARACAGRARRGREAAEFRDSCDLDPRISGFRSCARSLARDLADPAVGDLSDHGSGGRDAGLLLAGPLAQRFERSSKLSTDLDHILLETPLLRCGFARDP